MYAAVGEYKFWQIVTGECGTDSTLYLVNIIPPTYVDNTLYSNKLDIFPNPTNGIVQFTSPAFFTQSGTIQVYDMIGRLIFTKLFPPIQAGETVSINLGDQPKGIYLLRIRLGDREYYGKVILVK